MAAKRVLDAAIGSLPTREGWGDWQRCGSEIDDVQNYQLHGRYGVIGDPIADTWAVVYAEDGVTVEDRLCGIEGVEDALDAADALAEAD